MERSRTQQKGTAHLPSVKENRGKRNESGYDIEQSKDEEKKKKKQKNERQNKVCFIPEGGKRNRESWY